MAHHLTFTDRFWKWINRPRPEPQIVVGGPTIARPESKPFTVAVTPPGKMPPAKIDRLMANVQRARHGIKKVETQMLRDDVANDEDRLNDALARRAHFRQVEEQSKLALAAQGVKIDG